MIHSSAVEPLKSLYQSFLARLADQAGLHTWLNMISAGTSLSDVTAAFVEPAEFMAKFSSAPSLVLDGAILAPAPSSTPCKIS
jgi:Domain of unknown function (DUF4214)